MSLRCSPALRLAAVIWAFGMLGFIAVVTLHLPKLLPQILQGRNAGVPMIMLQFLALAQGAVLVGVAAWVGAKTASAVGLRAPWLEAMVSTRSAGSALVIQLRPGLLGGILVGLFLFAVNALGPDEWVKAQAEYYPDVLTRVLFGGITEEVLMRWGLMSFIVWLLSRPSRARERPVRASHLWIGIIAVAVLFGVAHLPAVESALGQLDTFLVMYIVVGNAVGGTVFGWLYWKHGLEAAVIAHALAHLVNYLLGLI